MVRVPDYQPNVSLRPIMRQDIDVRATPEAFGSDIGRGLVAAGAGLGDMAQSVEKVQQLTNEAKSKNGRAGYSNGADALLYDPESGYLQKQGSAALSGRPDFERKLAELEKTFKTDMTPAQAAMFDREIAAVKNEALRKGMVHQGTETKRYVSDAAIASAESYRNDAITNAADPAKRDENLTRGVNELRSLGGKLGWSDEKLRLEAQKYVSDGHVKIATQLAQADPIAGLEYLSAKSKQLLPEDSGRALASLAAKAGTAIANDGLKYRGAAGPAPKDAATLIRSFEGYRDTPYWDVNAHRVGYGSDTVTRADGTVERVQQGMKIDREDAERDLARRINQEFVPGIVKMVGAEKWGRLSDPAKASLASVAYNYGSLPFVVANAVVTGGPEQIAQAVDSLKDHNGGINAGRRAKEAAIIRGGELPAGMQIAGSSPAGTPTGAQTYSPRVAALLSQLPAGVSTQLRESAAAEMAQADARDAARYRAARSEAVDGYKLRIATDDTSLSRQEILSDPTIDKGDKATLVTSFDSKRSELLETQQAIAAFQAGRLTVDPYSDAGKKTVDRAWTMISAAIPQEQRLATVEEMVRQGGIVPEPIVHAVRGDLVSGKPASVATAAEIASRLRAINPAALERRAGGSEVLDASVAFDHLTKTVGLDRNAAAQRLIDMRDPEKAKARAALMTSDPVKEFIDKQATESQVRDVFDRGLFKLDPKLGETPATSAAMVAEYKEVLKESLFDTAGDQDLAKKMAAERFKRRYGVSEFTIAGPSVVARLPVELTYPADATGKRDYVVTQAREALSSAGVAADKVFLQADGLTERDVSAGRPARYQVWYMKGGVMERYHLPFFANAPTKADMAAAAKARSEQRRDANMDRQSAGFPGDFLTVVP
jgi:GH24 family phage-related lysozyme (muramidase)